MNKNDNIKITGPNINQKKINLNAHRETDCHINSLKNM